MKKVSFFPVFLSVLLITGSAIFVSADAQRRISFSVPEFPIADEDSKALPDSFLIKDDDSDHAYLIETGGKLFKSGDEVLVNDKPYTIQEVKQTLELEPVTSLGTTPQNKAKL